MTCSGRASLNVAATSRERRLGVNYDVVRTFSAVPNYVNSRDVVRDCWEAGSGSRGTVPILSVPNPKFLDQIFCRVNASSELKSVGPRAKI